MSNSNIRIRACHQPIWYQVFGRIEHIRGNLIQNLAFEGNLPGHDHVERGQSVARYHHQIFIGYVVYFSYFAFVYPFLVWKVKVCVVNGIHTIESK